MTTNINPAGASYTVASLYVGNLHPDVTEAMLFAKFSAAGPVLSTRVCRDVITRRSLGYAYVNFKQPEDAERAIETMNFDIINRQPIRIMWAKSYSFRSKSGGRTISIKNLDKSIDNKALYDTFSAFGNIVSCKIVCDKHGSRGYGFVHFETVEAAKVATEKVNGMLLNGTKVSISLEMKVPEILEDKQEKLKNLYFNNFANLSEEKIREIFEPFGNINHLKVMTDVQGKSRGFGLVCFQNVDEAQTAAEKLNGALIGDQTVFVGRPQQKTARQAELKGQSEKRNVYVKNLNDNIDDERLRKEFSQFGTITSAKVMKDGGRSKGFGFVCFRTQEEASEAIAKMHGMIIEERPLYVALAQQRDERKAFLASQYMQRIASIRLQGQPATGMMSQMSSTTGPRSITPIMTQGQIHFYSPTDITEVPQRSSSSRQPTKLQRPDTLSTTSEDHMFRDSDVLHVKGEIQAQNNPFEDFEDDVSDCTPSDDITSTFNDIIEEMALRPSNIEEGSNVIVQMLLNCKDEGVFHSIVDSLFEKSLMEPRFRYAGAKLAEYLSNKLTGVPGVASFINILLTKCKEEYLKKEETISNPDTVARFCGFAILMGELFLNLEVASGRRKQKIAILRFVIKDLLLILLEHSTNETVICATRVLERAGAVIEQTAYLNKPEEANFSEVFDQLRQLEYKGRLNQTTRASITSLLDLKSNNWVRRNSPQHHPVSTRVNHEEVYQDRERHFDSRILENNENTNDVQQLEENEDSQSSMQGAAGYTSKLLAEPLIAKEIEGTGNGNQKSVDNTDDKYMCKICFDDPVEVTFLPCMHACCCKNCSDKLKVKQCPICRKRIRQSRTLYFS